MSVLDNFDGWKSFLGDRLQHAQEKGMDEDAINGIAAQVGDHLASNIEPRNGEQRLLADLWRSADDDQKQVLASTMVKLVQNAKKE